MKPRPQTRMSQFAALAVLAAAGAVGNLLAIELFYGVAFIFGSIAIFLALTFLGPWAAILVAIAAGVPTILTWGHPLGLLTFTLEAALISILYRRGWKNLVVSDLIFWIAIGLPVILLLYPNVLGMSDEAVGLLALKQPLNGVFNALVAGLLLYITSQFSSHKGKSWAEQPNKLAGLLFHGLLAVILVTGATPIVLQGHYQSKSLRQDIEQELRNYAGSIASQLAPQTAAIANDSARSVAPVGTGDSRVRYFVVNSAGEVTSANTSATPTVACENQTSLLLLEPNIDNPIMRAQQGVFCLSQTIDVVPPRTVIVETDSANYVETLKAQSARDFLALAGTFALGLLVAWVLSRIVAVSLTRLSRVASETRNGVVVTDKFIQTVWVNESFSRISGFTRQDILGKNPGKLLQGPDTDRSTIEYMGQSIRRERPFTVELLNYRQDKTPYWVEINCNPIYDKQERLEGFIAVQTDITDRKKAQLSSARTEARLRLLIDQFPGAVLFESKERRLIVTNHRFSQMFRTGSTPRDLIGMDCESAARMASSQFPDPESFIARIEQVVADQEPVLAEQIEMTDGHAFERDFIPVRSPEGLVGYLWLYRDITERTIVEEQLREAAIVFSKISEGIMITDKDGHIIDANKGFEQITGYRSEEVIGKNPRILKSGLQDHTFYEDMYRTLNNESVWIGEIWNRRKSGELYAVRQTITAVMSNDGTVDRYISLFSDITELKQYQERLEQIVHYDPLTDLPNRELVSDRLRNAMSQTKRRGTSIGVGFIDLDGFKQVNDTLGHDAGDDLLKAIAKRLKRVLREGDTLGRIGGDEFIAILIDLESQADLERALERLVQAASDSIEIRGQLVSVSASIGASIYSVDTCTDADQLIRQADQAMYVAKRAGKNQYHVELMD